MDELIKREANWSTWKKNGCAPYERLPQSQEHRDAEKRKRERYTPPTYAVLVKRAKLKADADSIKNEGTIENCCVKLADAVPSIEEFLRAYEVAQDPENSIEDEYHPKNDKVYCWRALRLVVTHHLAWFAEMQKADLDVAVKKLQAKRVKTITPKMQTDLSPSESR